MKKGILVFCFFISLAHVRAQIQTDPKLVVLEIFKAAQTGNYENLLSLCDPHHEHDKDMQNICDLYNHPEADRSLFNEHFKTGRIVGDPEIRGNMARVKIIFGPDQKETENIILVKRENFWYLYSM